MIKYIIFVLLICWHFYLQFFAYFTYFFNHPILFNESSYDFIIVGAGTAGSLMAYRLSENGLYNVLLVEAGPSAPWFVDIPIVGPLLQQSVLDWEYQTTRQKYACKAMKGQKSGWPMGKLIGGTHWFNNMLYVRGEQNDYDNWFKNCSNYSYQKDILPFFEKFEEIAKITDETYSTISENVLEAGRKIGLNLTRPRATIDKKWGTRWTTSALLQQLYKRMNFVIATNSIVSKIVIDSRSGQAKAIEIVNERRKSETFRIKAKREIILCAGVIGTAKLLQLSGIGPKSLVEKLGIPLIYDLPVGDNLQDHVTTGLDLIVLDKPPKNQLNLPTLLSPWNLFRFLIWGNGPLRSTGCELITSICLADGARKTSDLQLMVMGTGAASDKGVFFKHALKIRNDFWSSYFRKLHDQYTISILPVVLHPRSRGFVRIRNTDPFQKPIIEPNYLTDDYDVSILLKGIELVQKIVSTRTMRDKLGARLVTNKINGCNHFEFNTTDYWTCYVRHLTLTAYHPVGTCKLGHWNDPETVVGFDFRVRYVNNLFVADGSVIPQLPSGNVNAAVAMISEKVADIILRKYSKQNIAESRKFFSDTNIIYDGGNDNNIDASSMCDLRSSCSIKNLFFIF